MNAPATTLAAPAHATASGWLVLAFDTLQLTLPQRSVRQVELASDLQPEVSDAAATAGWLLHPDGQSWPAYCLDGALRPLQPAPESRRLCVFFETGDTVCGLLCDRVSSLATDAELTVEPLPGCMTGLSSPVTGVARLRDGITAVTSATALLDYLTRVQESGRD